MEIKITSQEKLEKDINELEVGDVFFFIFDGRRHPYIFVGISNKRYLVFNLRDKKLEDTTEIAKVRIYNKAELNLEV